MPENIIENIVFLCVFDDFWGSGAHSGAILESGRQKPWKPKILTPLFGRLFGQVLIKNQILEHFCGICFLVYFWHRFYEARGMNLLPFWSHFRRLWRLFCGLFCKCCKSVKLQPLLSETPVFKGARPPLLHTFRYFFACVFRHAARTAFFADFLRFEAPNGIPWGVTFRIFCRFCLKKGVLKSRLEKWWILVPNCEGSADVAGPPGTCIYA